MATLTTPPLHPLLASSSSHSSSASTASSSGVHGNELTSPAISRIVKVTIACALIVLAVAGIILASKIAKFIRYRREAKRRQLIVASLDASMGMNLGATGQQNWMAQNSKKKWGGRKTKNAHKQVEWEGVAA